jgi:two-component sensor histidine kinase
MSATLRSRLGRALLVALTPVLALGAFHSVLSYRDEALDRRGALRAAALQSATDVGARMRSGSVVLGALAPEASGVACAPRLRALSGELGYANLVRLDAAGRVRCAAGPVRTQSVQGGEPWFRRLQSGEDFVVGPAPAGLTPGRPAMLAATRLGAEGRFEGALVSVLTLSDLRNTIASGALPSDTQVAVADANGRLYAGTDPDAFAPAVPENAVRSSATDPTRYYRTADRTGEWRDHVAAPLIGQEVFVLVSAPAPGLFSWARLNPLFSVVLPVLAFAFAFGAVWMATDRLIVRWLHYLQRIAAVYARGRFTVRPQVEDAPEEVQALARTLDEMAEGIVRRDQLLHDNLAQKDALLREIHHRVKNNLQVITSLLNLQQRALADPAGRAVLADTRQRITALALIYRALYQSEDLRRVDVRSFLEELVGQLVNSEGPRESPLRASVTADELRLDPDKLAPFALFAVEAVTNAQKHAFPSGGGAITVQFRVADQTAELLVEDDGVGADLEAMQGGVGRTLMTAFARQLRGKAEIAPRAEGGVAARLTFPLPEPPAVQA